MAKNRYAPQPQAKTSNYEWKKEREAKAIAEKKEKAARRRAARIKEIQEIKDYISSLAGEQAIDGKEKLQLSDWRKLREQWEGKEKLIRQIANSGDPSAEQAIHYLLTENPTTEKWDKIADTFASGGSYVPDENIVFTPGHREMENFKNAGVLGYNPGPFSADQSEYIANTGWDRRYYISQGSQATSDPNWNEVNKFNDYLEALLKRDDLTPVQRAKIAFIKQEYGHQGAVGIPGYRSRGNYLGNIQSELAKLNSQQGPGMTLAEVLNADTHMTTSGGRVTLSKDSADAVARFMDDPDLAKFVGGMPKGILEIPVLAKIEDPVRAAILEKKYKTSDGIPLKEHLMFDSDRKRAGRWASALEGDAARIRLAFEGGLPNSFDAAHQNRIIRPEQIPTELVEYIQNQVEPEIKVALAEMTREVAELDALEGRVETGQSQLQRGFKNLPEDMQKKILQKGFANPLALSVIAGVAGISLPLMSERGRAKAAEGALNLLEAYDDATVGQYKQFAEDVIPAGVLAAGNQAEQKAVEYLDNPDAAWNPQVGGDRGTVGLGTAAHWLANFAADSVREPAGAIAGAISPWSEHNLGTILWNAINTKAEPKKGVLDSWFSPTEVSP